MKSTIKLSISIIILITLIFSSCEKTKAKSKICIGDDIQEIFIEHNFVQHNYVCSFIDSSFTSFFIDDEYYIIMNDGDYVSNVAVFSEKLELLHWEGLRPIFIGDPESYLGMDWDTLELSLGKAHARVSGIMCPVYIAENGYAYSFTITRREGDRVRNVMMMNMTNGELTSIP